MKLGLDADQLLTTTRVVRRRLDLDRPVSRAILEERIEIAFQAPSGGTSRDGVGCSSPTKKRSGPSRTITDASTPSTGSIAATRIRS